MEGSKKYIVIGILVVVIALAIGWIVRSHYAPAEKPKWRLEEEAAQKMTLIDAGDLSTVLVKTRGEWEDLGKKHGKYKNPESGEYTMELGRACEHCREVIPALRLGPEGTEGLSREESMAKRRAADQALRDYVCPRCGASNPFTLPPMW